MPLAGARLWGSFLKSCPQTLRTRQKRNEEKALLQCNYMIFIRLPSIYKIILGSDAEHVGSVTSAQLAINTVNMQLHRVD